jgi:hypothetical protein
MCRTPLSGISSSCPCESNLIYSGVIWQTFLRIEDSASLSEDNSPSSFPMVFAFDERPPIILMSSSGEMVSRPGANRRGQLTVLNRHEMGIHTARSSNYSRGWSSSRSRGGNRSRSRRSNRSRSWSWSWSCGWHLGRSSLNCDRHRSTSILWYYSEHLTCIWIDGA